MTSYYALDADVRAGFVAAGAATKAANVTARAAQQASSLAVERSIEAEDTANAAQAQAVSAQRAAGRTPMDFGAVGDGVADDTAAVLAAMQYAGTVDWLDKTYRITTGISATLAGPAVWKSRGAVIRLDSGSMISRAVDIEVNGHALVIDGPRLTIDGGSKAVTAVRILNNSAVINPDLVATGLVARNAYRADTAIAGGDGIIIAGNFHKVTLTRPEAHDCFMASGAGVAGSQGIFGITITQASGRYAKHIVIRDAVVRNVWSLDPAYTNDQDGLRIFQDMTDPDATCLVDGYTCENVSNRALKFHSVPNGRVQNVTRVLDSAVVPQTVNFSNPDFDAQQAPASFKNIKVHYKGRCHNEIIRTATDPGDYRYGGAQVDGFNALIEGLPGNTIRVVGAVSSAGDTGTTFADSQYRIAVQNVTIVGPVARLVSVNLRGAGTNIVLASNIVAEVTEAAFVASGSSTATLITLASNIANTGVVVPLTSGFTGSRTITVNGQHGFT